MPPSRLKGALALKPGDARASTTCALVERRERNSDAEVADLEKVVAEYPESRDARRELGISYYQQHRADQASPSSRPSKASILTTWPRITTWPIFTVARD